MTDRPAPPAATNPAAPRPAAPDAVLAAGAWALRKSYGRGDARVHALRGVDLGVLRGRFTAITGPSGSGKSTLMHCLAGLERPDSGGVTVAGTDLSALDDDALTVFRREHLGFVFQSFNLLPTLTAWQNILLPLELGQRGAGGRLDTATTGRAREVAGLLGIADRLTHRPAELSGGQQQRVAIARALVTRPALLFADEPTGNLDSATSAEVLGHLRRSVDELGRTVVLVTHDPRAADHADVVVTMADGRVV